MAWRSWDRPRVGTIYRLPDDLSLQRGITYTILPDGRNLRVPAMNRLVVRSQAQSHDDNEGNDIVQALQDMLKGKKPVKGRARFNRHGIVHRPLHGHVPMHGGPAVMDPGEQLLRPVELVGGGGLDEM